MNARRILIAALVLAAAGLAVNQWRLQRIVSRLSDASRAIPGDASDSENAEAKLRRAEARLNEARTQPDSAEVRIANANSKIAQLDNRLRQLEAAPRRRRPPTEVPILQEIPLPPADAENTARRSWGPEQAVGEPDTFQAGDIPTAWAPLEQDAGEEWLKLDYETSVDIAEVRVRETHNPGAISKVTAFLANGTEVTLWEGAEPPANAPVEMSFQIPDHVNGKSVKVYLDTKRVPGWNEIDAVELIGRDGSQQWARKASASSTFAEPRVGNRERVLEKF